MARHFAHWLKEYCQFTAQSEAPTDFHFWTGVSTIAAVLQRKVWKDELLFKWTPNFYIIFVGPPGIVTKSTTLNIGYKLLAQLPDFMFGPDSMTWHGLAKKFEAAVEYKQWQINGKAQKPILQSALTCSISELGTFLRPDDSGLVSFLTDIWDGKERAFEHTTATATNAKIERPWLNIIGATTPEWMQNNFPVSMLSEGLGSRIVFVHGDKKRHLVAYPSRATKIASYHEYEKKLFEDLAEIRKLVGPYDLTDDAYKWGEDWYAKHNSTRSPHMASGRYGGYLARKQTHMHKLAMILAAAQRDTLVIEKQDLEDADAVLTDAERSMIKVFESVGVVDEAKHIAEIMAFVRAYKFLTKRELYRMCYNIMAEKDMKEAIRLAVEGDLLEVRKGPTGELGVAPKTRTLQ